MNLVIDIGNTQAKLAVFDKDTVVHYERTKNLNLSDYYNFRKNAPPYDAAVLSSVGIYDPDVRAELGKLPVFIELNEKTPLPVKNSYRTPETLGKDRLAAAAGAAGMFSGKDLLVIDAGTCITIDFIDKKGVYYGGSISPGIEMRFKALHTFTTQLPLVNRVDRVPVTGRSTSESIASGILNGIIGEIDGMISHYVSEYPDLKVIITGGDAEYFDKRLKNNIFALPKLVLIGLNRILEYNRLF